MIQSSIWQWVRTRSVEQATRGSVSVYSGAVLKELPLCHRNVWQNPPHQPELLGMVSAQPSMVNLASVLRWREAGRWCPQ